MSKEGAIHKKFGQFGKEGFLFLLEKVYKKELDYIYIMEGEAHA